MSDEMQALDNISTPNLILSSGTQVVIWVELKGAKGETVQPAGAVGVVVETPKAKELTTPDRALGSRFNLGDLSTTAIPFSSGFSKSDALLLAKSLDFDSE